MKFLFNLMNHTHGGQRTLEDVIGIMGRQLRALGHQATWDPSNKHLLPGDRGWNVMVEGFTQATVDTISEYYAKGARFLFLATEEPTPRGFNHGLDPEMVMRQATFAAAARYCAGILHLVPGQHVTQWYAQHAPAAQAELGYAPELLRREPARLKYDFGFFGTLSERRRRVLHSLHRRTGKPVLIVSDFPTQDKRDALMRQCRVVLQVRKHEEMGLVSSSRCCTALCLGRPVVAEPHALSHPWDQVVRFSKTTEDFVTDAAMVAGMWQGVWGAQFSKFKELLTPEVCVGAPLRALGVLPALEAAA